MSKKIEFDYEGEHYTLEYNRKSIEMLEKNGFRLAEFESKLMTNIPLLFHGAFFMHHPTMMVAKVDEIYDNLEDKKSIAAQLYGMVAETYNTLFEEKKDEEGEETKKISWKVV